MARRAEKLLLQKVADEGKGRRVLFISPEITADAIRDEVFFLSEFVGCARMVAVIEDLQRTGPRVTDTLTGAGIPFIAVEDILITHW